MKIAPLKIPEPTEDELTTLYKNLSDAGNPVILSIIPPHSERFVPRSCSDQLPKLLTSLYNKTLINISYPELLKKCEDVFTNLSITTEEAKVLEKATQSQSACNLWFNHRAGQTTASRLKSAVHTNPSDPSKSLINAICYPVRSPFSTEATKWGCKHESVARDEYISASQTEHENFKLCCSGLIIDPIYPHLGASPDGMVQCDCCGAGTLEIKCPFSCQNKSFTEACDNPYFFLENADEIFSLKKFHSYYYQVQAQMKLSKTAYCDFVTWRETELLIIRVLIDETFICNAISAATVFYKKGILPEL